MQKTQFKKKVELNQETKDQAYIKGFAENNENLITRLRYIRFYTTLLLKDMLMDFPLEKISEFYGVPVGTL